MPRFSQQVINALANPSYGMLTGQALANTGERLAEVPQNVMEERKRQQIQAAYGSGMTGIQNKDPDAVYQSSQELLKYGKPEAAVSMLGTAQELETSLQDTARTNALRTNVIARAKAIPGMEGMASTAINANAEQLESMRVELLAAENTAQKDMDMSNAAATAAEAAGVSEGIIKIAKGDPELLSQVTQAVLIRQETDILDDAEDKRQVGVQVKRATDANLPKEIVDDIKAGLYLGENSDVNDLISGKAYSQQNYQVQQGSSLVSGNNPAGSLIALPTLGGKVMHNGKLQYPSDLGIIIGPVVKADGKVTDRFTSGQKMLPMFATSAGVTTSFIDSLDNSKTLNNQLLASAGTSVVPFNIDFTKNLEAYQEVVPEVLSRLASGAVIKDIEKETYENLFTVNVADFTSPVAAAEKIIRSAALISMSTDLMSNVYTPQEVSAKLREAASITLTEEDIAAIKGNKKGSLKTVIKKYTDGFLDVNGSGGSTFDDMWGDSE
jgi:hypothetical protein